MGPTYGSSISDDIISLVRLTEAICFVLSVRFATRAVASCCLLRSLQIKSYNQEALHRVYLDARNAPRDSLLGNVSPDTFGSNQESHELYKDESSTLQEITTLFEFGKIQ